jgi:NADPH-dependent curcumin reductase CurA
VTINRQVILKSRPQDIPQAKHFAFIETPLAAPSAGQVLIRNIYLSVEPAMRGWVSDLYRGENLGKRLIRIAAE